MHGMPTVAKAAAAKIIPASPPALSYHGGPVMTTTTTYAIFWTPPTLQNGTATSLPTSYQNIQTALLTAYPGHGIDNNNTQYYMTSGTGFLTFTDFVQNVGTFGGSYVDTSAYPASGCSDFVTGSNCLSDAQIQAEVSKVMALKGWTGGMNHIFFVYTSSGEGSCGSGLTGCAYTDYCAYHGYFASGATTVLYGNEPYAAAPYCQAGTSPNGDAAGDAAASVTSHELTEAITDPLLNAWYSASGEEIGDLCAWTYGTNTWGTANESWPIGYSNIFIFGHPPITSFELQEEYDNHTGTCVQVGP
jgi:hypothetical protein